MACHTWLTLIASSMSLAALAAACGPKVGPEPDPKAPVTRGTGTSAASAQPDVPAPKGPDVPGPAPTATPEPAPAKAQAVTVQTSKMLAEVKALGVDMTKPMSKMNKGKKKKLMPLFQKSLGFKDCGGCHEGSDGVFDFQKETANLEMARGMWNHYIVELRDEKGGELFCDSCHNGEAHLLPRDDKDAMQAFMTNEYEGKLTRADGEEHSCSSCHTDVFEPKIFKDVWGLK